MASAGLVSSINLVIKICSRQVIIASRLGRWLLQTFVLSCAFFKLDAQVKTFQSAKRFDRQYKTDQCVVIFDQV